MLTFNEYLTKQNQDRQAFYDKPSSDGTWNVFTLLLKIKLQKIIASLLVPATLVQFVIFPRTVMALPSGYTVESGQVSFDTSTENMLTINASDQAIIKIGRAHV